MCCEYKVPCATVNDDVNLPCDLDETELMPFFPKLDCVLEISMCLKIKL